MARLLVSLVSVVAAGLVVAGCSQGAPAPGATQAPAASTKAAEPTKALAATPAPTLASPAAASSAPTKKVGFPEKNRPITLIVPFPAGGPLDVGARIIAPAMEKELGTSVQIVNKAGASGQVGTTELVRSKPDGYTLGVITQPATAVTYIDPEAKAVYTRKDFQPVAMYTADPYAIGVKSDGPYKTLKDLLDAAKARPGELKVATAGLLSPTHFTVLMLQQAAEVEFSRVHFDGAAPAATALLGGHVDSAHLMGTGFAAHVNSGAVRLLGLIDNQESSFFPGVKTLREQGYDVYLSSNTGLAAPAGTPKEVVDILSGAVKRALDSDEVKNKMKELTYAPRYVDSAQYATYYEEAETAAAKLLPLIRK